MKKFLLALSAVVIFSSIAFAYTEDDARDALIVYSGTEAFTYLTSEERSACMAWVADGGYMNELCRNAVTKLISQDPDAVSPEHRKALLAAASGRTEEASAPARAPARTPEYEPAPRPSGGETVIVKEKKSDNTGAVIAAGVAGVIAGMVIHNNLPKDKTETVYYPVPDRRPPHHAPAPPHRPPHYYRGPRRH